MPIIVPKVEPPNLYSVFRKRYPQYNDLSEGELYRNLVQPAKFKQAFPEYSDMSDADILRRVQKFAPKGSGPLTEAAITALSPFRMQPIESIKEIGRAFTPGPVEPLQKTLTRTIPGKLNQFIKGAGGLVFPPLLAAGVVAAPAVTIPLIAGIELGRRGVKKGIEAVTPQPPLTPELTELASEVVPLIAAPIVAGRVSRARSRPLFEWTEHFKRQGLKTPDAQRAAKLSVAKGDAAPVKIDPATFQPKPVVSPTQPTATTRIPEAPRAPKGPQPAALKPDIAPPKADIDIPSPAPLKAPPPPEPPPHHP